VCISFVTGWLSLGSRKPKISLPLCGRFKIFNRCFSYMVQDEDNEAGVEGGQGHDDALVALHRGEHLVQEWVQIRKTAHEDRYGD
jgi:hypothetical protein